MCSSLHATSSTVVDAPVEEVFQYLANPENQLQWQTNLREVQSSGTGEGSTITEVRTAMGHRIEYNLRVTQFQENARISAAGESTVQDARVERNIYVSPRGSKTLVSIEIENEARELAEDSEAEWMAERVLQRESDNSMVYLKELFERPLAIQAAQRHLPRLTPASQAREW
jgi:uncharacterized protein YndB with AHSA1/START domain